MNNSTNPDWVLSDQWAVGRDRYNWTLYKMSGKNWRPCGYYPSAEQLLMSLHRKISRVEPKKETLVSHIEYCLEVAQAAADLLAGHVDGQASLSTGTPAPAEHSSSEASNSASFDGKEVSDAS